MAAGADAFPSLRANGRANARPITGSAKQSRVVGGTMDCFVASASRNDGWGSFCDKFDTTAAPGVALAKPGQITSDCQKSCQAPESKIFRFTFLEIRIITPPVSRPQEGRIMIVTTRGARDVMDALASGVFNAGRKRQGVRRSRVVLAPRCWC